MGWAGKIRRRKVDGQDDIKPGENASCKVIPKAFYGDALQEGVLLAVEDGRNLLCPKEHNEIDA